MNFWDFIELKNFCTVKETINRTKRQPIEWERIFANAISNEGLVSRGAWVAQSVKNLTLDFGSGHDLRILRSSPMLGFVLSVESA